MHEDTGIQNAELQHRIAAQQSMRAERAAQTPAPPPNRPPVNAQLARAAEALEDMITQVSHVQQQGGLTGIGERGVRADETRAVEDVTEEVMARVDQLGTVLTAFLVSLEQRYGRL